jgi:UDP-2-acetamido-2,6-beta-L-arabino-hexul-4-ose reductase
MIKVGVTGSNGFIGWHLCRTIELEINKFELIEFKRDWFNEDTNLDSFVSKCDIIVHLAGLNRHHEESVINNTNISLAQKLVDSFKRTGFKGQIIFSSSIQEEKNNIFGNSKKAAREIFARWGDQSNSFFHGVIIPNVFGAFGLPFYNSVISTFCYQLVNSESPKIQTDSTLKLIYVSDLVKNIIDLFNTETNKKLIIRNTDEYKVSEILELLFKYKKEYFEIGQIPALNSQFEINLFNTFRSYINLNSFYPVKYKQHTDDRGAFTELVRLNSGGQVSFSTTVPGITRGNHFHTRKIERFSVIKGKAQIQLRKIGTSEMFDFELDGAHPAYVDMPIWYTHNITNIGEEELYTVFWINETFDPTDPDTYFVKV